MRPVPHLERIINKKMRLPPDRTYQSSTLKAGPRRMNTWILDTAIARLLSTNAVVLTEPPNSQMVCNPEVGQKRAWRNSITISSKPTSGPEQFPDCALNAGLLLGALRPELRTR